MTALKKLLLTAVVLGTTGGGSHAQVTGSNTSSVGGSSTASSSGSGSSSSGGNRLSNTDAFTAPTISGLDTSSGSTRSFLQPSNIFGSYYANPFFAGGAAATNKTAPGGFGQALYASAFSGGSGITSPSSSGSLGSSGNAFSSAAVSPGSSFSGFGGNTGSSGGFGSTNRGGQQFGQNRNTGGLNQTGGGFGGTQAGGVVVPAPGPIAYTATLMFATPAPVATRVAADLRGMLDRSSMLTSARTIDLFTDGTVVVLRGTVPTAQEAETAEGMVRLTPGVFEVRNELKVAAPAAPAPAVPVPVAPAIPAVPPTPAP